MQVCGGVAASEMALRWVPSCAPADAGIHMAEDQQEQAGGSDFHIHGRFALA